MKWNSYSKARIQPAPWLTTKWLLRFYKKLIIDLSRFRFLVFEQWKHINKKIEFSIYHDFIVRKHIFQLYCLNTRWVNLTVADILENWINHYPQISVLRPDNLAENYSAKRTVPNKKKWQQVLSGYYNLLIVWCYSQKLFSRQVICRFIYITLFSWRSTDGYEQYEHLFALQIWVASYFCHEYSKDQ